MNFASNAYDDDERKRDTQEPSGPKNVELRIRMRHASYATSSLKFVSIRSFFGWRHFNCNFTARDMKSLKSVLRPSVYHLRRYFGGKFLSKLLNRQFIYLRIPQKKLSVTFVISLDWSLSHTKTRLLGLSYLSSK